MYSSKIQYFQLICLQIIQLLVILLLSFQIVVASSGMSGKMQFEICFGLGAVGLSMGRDLVEVSVDRSRRELQNWFLKWKKNLTEKCFESLSNFAICNTYYRRD